jgi:hypothetical protein
MLKLELSFADAAANSVAALPANSDAPVASVARRNRRRLMPLQNGCLFAPKTEFFIDVNYVHIESFHEASCTSFRFVGESIPLAAEFDGLAACTPQQLVPRIDAFATVPATP